MPLEGEKLRRLLQSLRVNEIKMVLRCMGARTSGNKPDLMERVYLAYVFAEALGKSDEPSVQAVEQILAKLRPHFFRATASSTSRDESLVATSLYRSEDYPSVKSVRIKMSPYKWSAQPLVICPCGVTSSPENRNLVLCHSCQKYVHAICLDISPRDASAYKCAQCRVVALDPFLRIPSLPESQARGGMLAECIIGHTPELLTFTLSTRECQLLQGGPLKVRLTSFPGCSKKRNHCWPKQTGVWINGDRVNIVQYPPAFNGREWKDRNLDERLFLCNLRPGNNSVQVSPGQAPFVKHVLSIMILEETNVCELLRFLKANARELDDMSRQRIRNFFVSERGGLGGDDELMATSIQVTLLCPLTRVLMSTPARCQACRHLEAFDLEAFLECQRAAKFPHWRCPICDAEGLPSMLVIDTFLQEAIYRSSMTVSSYNIAPSLIYSPLNRI